MVGAVLFSEAANRLGALSSFRIVTLPGETRRMRRRLHLFQKTGNRHPVVLLTQRVVKLLVERGNGLTP